MMVQNILKRMKFYNVNGNFKKTYIMSTRLIWMKDLLCQ